MKNIFLIFFLLFSCSQEQASKIGYLLGYTFALQASYEGSSGDLHFYSVPNCNRTYYSLNDGNYNNLDCRYYDLFSSYVVETTYKLSKIDLYFED